MSDEEKKVQEVNKELRKDEPGLTIDPPYLKMQQEPIPNPDVKNENKK